MTVYITRSLAEGLLEFARDAEPDDFSVGLEVTRAADLDGEIDVDPNTPVFTHFYHPQAGRSVNVVFGMDFGTPVGATRGRFVSHPQGKRRVELTDDLHAILLIAVPPWDLDSLAAYDRRGRRNSLVLIDADPPDDAPLE